MDPFTPLLAIADTPDPTDRARALTAALDRMRDIQARLRQARQDAVLQMRTGGMSHADVAAALGVTRSRAQQIALGQTHTRRKDLDVSDD